MLSIVSIPKDITINSDIYYFLINDNKYYNFSKR